MKCKTRSQLSMIHSFCTVAGTTLAVGLGSGASAQTIVDVGVLPGGTWSLPASISADGQVVSGTGDYPTGSHRGWRWTASTGMTSLGVAPGGSSSSAYGMNATGSVIVGVSGQTYDVAAMWTASGGMVSLGSLGVGKPSFAFDSSADGSVVVGDGYLVSGPQRAFRWTAATGMVQIAQSLPGCAHSLALAISGDGSTIAGYCFNNYPSLIEPTACMWTPDGTIHSLGGLPGRAKSVPGAVSSDGGVIVGYAADSNGQNSRAFRWTSATGMVDLGMPAGATGAIAGSLTADGSTVAGYFLDPVSGDARGMIWTAATGAVPLTSYLSALGVDMTGWILRTANISADGQAMTGWGIHNGLSHGWYLAIGCTGAPVITSDPASQSVLVGDPVSFSVTSTGGGIHHQWYHDGSAIPGAVGSSYGISSAVLSDAGDYWCVLTSSCGNATSQTATLTVTNGCTLPTIVNQPDSQSVALGDGFALLVETTGTGPFSYAWSHNSIDIPSTDSPIFQVDAATEADGGMYQCRVSNDCGPVLSAAAFITVTGGCTGASIVENPADQSACPGSTILLSVGASGSGSLGYQWRRDGEDLVDGLYEGGGTISGATTSTLTILGAQTLDSAEYDCWVTNDCGADLSSAAFVTICAADVDCSGFVDTEDFDEFVGHFEEGSDDADFDGSGFVDLEDFIAFVQAFEAGC